MLLDFLSGKLGSRKEAKSLLEHFSVVVNGKVRTKYDFPLKAGDRVSTDYRNRYFFLEKNHVRIIHEDSDVLVIDKPCGLLSVSPDDKNLPNAFDIMKKFVRAADERGHIYVTHRIDRDTSGVLLFCKSGALRDSLQDDWNSLVTERMYYAVAEGRLERKQDVLTSFLKRDGNGMVYNVSERTPGAEKAITEYRVIRESENHSLLDISIKTGKKNQIRAALKDIGHPVAGDKKYGAATDPLKRLCLHAYRLALKLPDGRTMSFASKAPKEFFKL